MDSFSLLNSPQKKAVQHTAGPLLIIAGAGSGKTRVLTYRIAHLINEHRVQPHNILAVTFTNKAAAEMRERVESIVGPMGEKVWMSTFHSLCVQILRFDGDKLGYKRNFLIFDSGDQQTVIKDCMKDLNLDPKKFDFRAILGTISNAKNELLTAEDFEKRAADFWENTVARVYQLYQQKMRDNEAFDFDDLIMCTVRLFQQCPEVLQKYQRRFQYVMVDEYQDTNHAQYVLINMLADLTRNICVVGDEDQSIYAFRGADIRNILEFEKDYPDATVIKLEENYRSTPNILEAANSVIGNNTERKPKKLWTSKEKGEKVFFHQAPDERREADFIADCIVHGVKEKSRHYQHFTILYRAHAQSRVVEEAFMRRGIPYRIVSGLRFYERKEIKDLLAYLRLVYNPDDVYSLRRIINVPKRGIGDTTLAKIATFAQEQEITMYEALGRVPEIAGLSGKYANALQDFRTMMDGIIASAEQLTLTSLTESILVKSGYISFLNAQKSVESEGRIENLNEFLSVTGQFEKEHEQADLSAFLEHIALVSDVDNYDQDADVVNMMTIHAAKGLEFPVVFMVGLEDGVFPHSRALWEPGQLEEERRLAYVGMTRAEEELYLTCARVRTIYGTMSNNAVSTFVQEVNPELLVEVSGVPDRTPEVVAKPVVVNQSDFKVGDKINHPKWGNGMVVAVATSGPDLILSLAFPNQDIKKVMAHLAPIEKLG